MTRAALPRGAIPYNRLLRIQLATKAVANMVPGGSAAGSALGYRLLTTAGVRGPDAGFALATSGLGSAVVLNIILWIALLVSIPAAGFNPLYVTAAIVGVVIMGLFAAIVIGLIKGEEAAERALRAVARRVKWLDEERTGAVVNRLGQAAPGADVGAAAAAAGHPVGRRELAARRGVAVDLPAGVRRHGAARRPASSPSVWPTSWPPCRSRRAASASSKVCSSRRWSASVPIAPAPPSAWPPTGWCSTG